MWHPHKRQQLQQSKTNRVAKTINADARVQRTRVKTSSLMKITLKEYKRFRGEICFNAKKIVRIVWFSLFRINRIQLFERVEMFEK